VGAPHFVARQSVRWVRELSFSDMITASYRSAHLSLFSLISILIALAAIASYINYQYFKLPTTIGVMLVALLASLAIILAGPFAGGFREHTASLLSQIDFEKVVLHGLLAFLLFAGSIHVDLDDLAREWLTISLLAVLGTLASTFIVGGLTYLMLGWLGLGIPFMHALLFGALISPTDPIAVLGIMQSVGAPRQLEVQIAGESLFNDGIGVVIFLIIVHLSGLAGGHGPMGAGEVGFLLLREIGGAVVLGLGTGLITYYMLKRVDNYQVEVLLTLALAMGVYALTDSLHFSAPIASVIAGLFVGSKGRTLAMSEKTREHVDDFWELIDEILNAVLFLLIGLELLVLPLEKRWVTAGLLAIPLVLLARWVCIFGIVTPLRPLRAQAKGAVTILTWGGLRGAISVAMALAVPTNDSRSLLLTLTYCVVIFSILVQGLSVGWLIRRTTRPPHGASTRPDTLTG
jgi:CPA1 family monovalent cation:H+ antiporter